MSTELPNVIYGNGVSPIRPLAWRGLEPWDFDLRNYSTGNVTIFRLLNDEDDE